MRAWVAAFALLSGCNQDTPLAEPPSAGSETHWLGDCTADGIACPAGSECLCGICTRPCAAGDACGEGGTCAAAGEGAFDDLCGPAPGAVCVPACEGDDDCPTGTRCAGGECRAVRDGDAGLGREIAGLRAQSFGLPAAEKIDVLFVVDDSGSMCEEQEALGRAFAEVAGDLAGRDFRVAVVSTDMRTPGRGGAFLGRPAPPTPSLNCVDPGTGMPKPPDTADCADLLDGEGDLRFGKILRSDALAGDTPAARQADLARKLRCMTTLGTSGDGFEKGLEAMRLALSCDGPNAAAFGRCCAGGRYDPQCAYTEMEGDAPAFLRPDAALAVVFVGDEDDCSAPMDNLAASSRFICRHGVVDRDLDNVPDAYADAPHCAGRTPRECFVDECDGLRGPDCFERWCTLGRDDNSNCVWNADRLTPVEEYRDFLVSLKRRPGEQIVVMSVVGDPAYTEQGDVITFTRGRPDPVCDPSAEAYDPDVPRSQCCPEGVCRSEIQPSCESALGLAFHGRRYAALADAFGVNGCGPERDRQPTHCGLCHWDPARALAGLRPVAWDAIYCLDEPPACLVADVEGRVAPCATDAERAESRRYAVGVYVECARTLDEGGACVERLPRRRLSPAEYRLDPEPRCAGGRKLALAATPPRGATVTVEYLVAPP